MPKIIVVDQKACTGCRQCELVCSVKHTGTANPARSRIYTVKWEAEGFYLPMFCQQCIDAPCAAVCPKGAISTDKDLGREVINYDLCIGCKMCVMACPFGAMCVDAREGRVIKCDLCDGEPTCVSFCEAKALQYVDADTAHIPRMRTSGARLSELLKK
jgi:Fe-S-cluster-containing hydrogenase component 2